MTHYEIVCPKCFVVMEHPAISGQFEQSLSACRERGCPYKKVYSFPKSRKKEKIRPYEKVTLRFNVEVTVDEKHIAYSEFKKLKSFVGNARCLKETILRGIDRTDDEFREIDPLRNIKVKVKKKG